MRRTLICLAGLAALGLHGAADAHAATAVKTKAPVPAAGGAMQVAPDIDKRVAQFAPTPLAADLSALQADDRKVLAKLVRAAKLMNEIFLRQAWAGNPALREKLKTARGPHMAAGREYF